MPINVNINTPFDNYLLSWANEEEFTKIAKLQIGSWQFFGPSINDLKYFKNFNQLANIRYWVYMLPLIKKLKNPKNILDIGSGLSITDLLLSKMFPETKFYLLDKSQVDTFNYSNLYVDKIEDYGFYNSWDVVRDGIKNSNLSADNFYFLDITDPIPDNIDVIISTFSWAWHYPLLTYWDKIKEKLNINGYLYLDIRHDADLLLINNYFNFEAKLVNIWHKPINYPINYNSILGKRYIWTNNRI